jgi:hypothetical protein
VFKRALLSHISHYMIIKHNKARLNTVVKEGFIVPIYYYTRNRMHSPIIKIRVFLFHILHKRQIWLFEKDIACKRNFTSYYKYVEVKPQFFILRKGYIL